MKKVTMLLCSIALATILYGCVGVPEVIKNSSREIVVAHEKYATENDRFLETMKTSLGEYIDLQIDQLKKDRSQSLAEAKQDKIDDFLNAVRKKSNVPKDAPVPVGRDELEDLTKQIEKRQREQGAIYDEGIEKLTERKKTIADVVELMKSYHKGIQQAAVALDSYLQLEKADEATWNGIKEMLIGRSAGIDRVLEKIETLRNTK